MNFKPLSLLAIAAACCALIAPVQAASVYLAPTTHVPAPGQSTASFELWMNFTLAEATLGGGIDIDLIGPISIASFVPSSYFTTVGDPAFSGFGAANANNDFQVHIGNFGGLSGNNLLGTFTVNLLQSPLEAALNLSTNNFFGGFFSVAGVAQTVTMTGATITAAIPEPASAALLLLGAVGVIARVRQQHAAA